MATILNSIALRSFYIHRKLEEGFTLHLGFGPKNRYVEEKKDWKKVDPTDFSAKHDNIYDWASVQLILLLNLVKGHNK